MRGIMKNRFLSIRKVLLHTVVLLAMMQILLGAAWAVLNLGRLPGFRETEELLQIADTMTTDEYVGILYPVFIRIAGLLEKLFHVPYYGFLYLLQLAVGCYALLKVLEGFRYRFWMALAVMTIPTVNQLFLAVLPQSLAASALLLCLCHCRKGDLPKGAVCWLLAGLLLPEYFLFCAVIFVVCLIGCGLRESRVWSRTFVKGIIGMLSVCLLAGVVNGFAVERYSRGRMARTPEAAILQRFVWPHFSDTYYFWRNEIKEVFTEDDMVEISRYPEGPMYQFGPELERVYGLDTARDYYLGMARITLRIRTKEVLKDVGRDFIQYAFPPVALVNNLRGRGVSYSGWNYGHMLGENGKLTQCYVFYACNAFLAVLLLVCCCGILSFAAGKGEKIGKRKKSDSLVLSLLLLSLGLTLWYTLSGAGIQDYKNVMPVSMAWGILMAEPFFGRKEGA